MKGVGTQGLSPLVPGTGIEPVRDSRLIGFSYYSMSPQPLTRCSLDSIFTISYDLGGWCIVSTHYALLHIGTVFPIRFHRLANFYSKGFPLGTLYSFLQSRRNGRIGQSPRRLPVPPHRHIQDSGSFVGLEPTKNFNIKQNFIILKKQLLLQSLLVMAAPLGFEPRSSPSEGPSFRDWCVNPYTTGRYGRN